MAMTESNSRGSALLYPFVLAVSLLGLWAVLSATGRLPHASFPTIREVGSGFVEELHNGRLANDIIVSLYRVGVSFVLAVALGVPLGLFMGAKLPARLTLLPYVNFFRSISPIAWLGFALAWFPVGDPASMFLIFQSAFWPLALSTLAATAAVPSVYYRVARDYGFTPLEVITKITFPAILPQLLTSLRVTLGLVWTVVVPAEMVAGKDGLGFAIQDDRNAIRPDLLVVHMIVIGLIGVILDRLLTRLTRLSNVRWGYNR
jgi:NitT/TauT family transport system permease protein